LPLPASILFSSRSNKQKRSNQRSFEMTQGMILKASLSPRTIADSESMNTNFHVSSTTESSNQENEMIQFIRLKDRNVTPPLNKNQSLAEGVPRNDSCQGCEGISTNNSIAPTFTETFSDRLASDTSNASCQGDLSYDGGTVPTFTKTFSDRSLVPIVREAEPREQFDHRTEIGMALSSTSSLILSATWEDSRDQQQEQVRAMQWSSDSREQPDDSRRQLQPAWFAATTEIEEKIPSPITEQVQDMENNHFLPKTEQVLVMESNQFAAEEDQTQDPTTTIREAIATSVKSTLIMPRPRFKVTFDDAPPEAHSFQGFLSMSCSSETMDHERDKSLLLSESGSDGDADDNSYTGDQPSFIEQSGIFAQNQISSFMTEMGLPKFSLRNSSRAQETPQKIQDFGRNWGMDEESSKPCGEQFDDKGSFFNMLMKFFYCLPTE